MVEYIAAATATLIAAAIAGAAAAAATTATGVTKPGNHGIVYQLVNETPWALVPYPNWSGVIKGYRDQAPTAVDSGFGPLVSQVQTLALQDPMGTDQLGSLITAAGTNLGSSGQDSGSSIFVSVDGPVTDVIDAYMFQTWDYEDTGAGPTAAFSPELVLLVHQRWVARTQYVGAMISRMQPPMSVMIENSETESLINLMQKQYADSTYVAGYGSTDDDYPDSINVTLANQSVVGFPMINATEDSNGYLSITSSEETLSGISITVKASAGQEVMFEVSATVPS